MNVIIFSTRTKIIALVVSLAILTTYHLDAQESNKGIYVDGKQNVYIQLDSPIYFYIATDTSQAPQRINVKNGQVSDKYIQISKHGVHHLKHKNIVTNRVEEIILNVDGMSPKTKLKMENATKSSFNGKIYYSGNMKLSLNAIDNMSKVKKTYYSINNSAFKEYTDTLSFKESGRYDFSYYSVDNVGNVEKRKHIIFNVDMQAPKVKLLLEGRRIDTIFTTNTTVKLFAEDDVAGVSKIYYQIDGGKWHICKNNEVPIKQLNDDEHTLKYYVTDRVNNESAIEQFRFYLDKKAPLVSLITLGDKFVLNNKTYFSGRTKLVLFALDNKSGVDSIMYSIDNKDYTKYSEAFYLPSEAGQHTIKYYAIDKVGNKGVGEDDYSVYAQKSDVFIVDLLGPDIHYKLIGNYIKRKQKILINKNTKIKISAIDKESGLKSIKYSVDDDTTEINYQDDIKVSEIADDHSLKLQFSAYDNVNNRNILPVSFILDVTPPEIFHFFSVKPKQQEEGLQTIPAYSKLFLAAKDALVGVKSIQYSINGSKYIKYRKAIRGFIKNKTYNIKVRAIDKLDNKNEYTVKFKTK